MSRLSYDDMGNEFDRLTSLYLEEVEKAPKGAPVVYQGIPTSDVLLSLWETHRARLLAAFKAGGWAEDEFSAENERRVEAMLLSVQAG